MSIVVQCASCQKRYSVVDSVAGRRVKCKSCGAVMAVPAAMAAAPAAVAAVGADADDPFAALAALERSPIRHASPPAPPALPAPALPAWKQPPKLEPRFVVPSPPTPAPAYGIQPRKAKVQSDSSGPGNVRKIIGLVVLLAIVVLLLVCWTSPGAGPVTTIASLSIGIGLACGGSFMITLAAFRESSSCGMMYLFVPFYPLYFFLTRLENTWKPFCISLTGFGILMFQIFVIDPPGKPGSLAKGGKPSADTRTNVDSEGRRQLAPPVAVPSVPNAADNTPTPATDPERERVDRVVRSIEALAARDFSQMSREQGMAELATLKASVKSERTEAQATAAANKTQLQWAQVDQRMAALERKVAALPSAVLDPMVYAEPGGLPSVWPTISAAPLADEVSFRGFRIRPPADALLDLTSSETDPQKGLVWVSSKEPACYMSLKQIPKTNPKQKQPWLVNRPFMVQAAELDRLLAIDTREASVFAATIDGVPFWRARVAPAGGTAVIRYIGSVGNDWIVADIQAGTAPARITEAFDGSVRSMRKAKGSEARIDPFSPAMLAARLVDKPDDALAALRRHRSAAEPFVLPLLASAEPKAARAAAIFLAEFGTIKSVPALRKAAESSDAELSGSARAALRRITPTEFDAMAELLLDLKGADGPRREESLKKLATSEPDSKRRAEVATMLEDLLLSKASGADMGLVGMALAKWYGDKTISRLMPILSREDSDATKRDAAIEAVSATKDKVAAAAILRWLRKEPEKTVAAMGRMGAVSEDPVVKLYNTLAMSRDQNDVAVRADCVRILSQIGQTSQSLTILTRAMRDPRDVPTQELAKIGIEAVKTRIAEARPATKP